MGGSDGGRGQGHRLSEEWLAREVCMGFPLDLLHMFILKTASSENKNLNGNVYFHY